MRSATGVPAARRGERVWTWNGAWRRPSGTAAEYIVLPAAQAVALPESTSYEAGACLGIPALTALHAVRMDGGVTDKSVLITGGAGAVGHYAIQMARLLGARTIIATVSNGAKAQVALQAGADETIDYRNEDVAARVAQITHNEGVHRVIEVDFAANVTAALNAVKEEGDIVVYGSGKPDVPVPFFPSILKNLRVRFMMVYVLTPQDRTAALAQLGGWLRDGKLQHQIAERLPLAQVVQAHELVEGGRVTGNVVLTIS